MYSHEGITVGSGITIRQNVRYCNDNPDCVAEAPYFEFIATRGEFTHEQ